MIKYLIEKEFKQLFRNPFIPKLILLFPCMIMILMPWAASLEVKNIRLDIIDPCRAGWCRKSWHPLISKFMPVRLPTMKRCNMLKPVRQILFWRLPVALRRNG